MKKNRGIMGTIAGPVVGILLAIALIFVGNCEANAEQANHADQAAAWNETVKVVKVDRRSHQVTTAIELAKPASKKLVKTAYTYKFDYDDLALKKGQKLRIETSCKAGPSTLPGCTDNQRTLMYAGHLFHAELFYPKDERFFDLLGPE